MCFDTGRTISSPHLYAFQRKKEMTLLCFSTRKYRNHRAQIVASTILTQSSVRRNKFLKMKLMPMYPQNKGSTVSARNSIRVEYEKSSEGGMGGSREVCILLRISGRDGNCNEISLSGSASCKFSDA